LFLSPSVPGNGIGCIGNQPGLYPDRALPLLLARGLL